MLGRQYKKHGGMAGWRECREAKYEQQSRRRRQQNIDGKRVRSASESIKTYLKGEDLTYISKEVGKELAT
jgi:hypothetical protein